jgi:hypothetical protein
MRLRRSFTRTRIEAAGFLYVAVAAVIGAAAT